jgi:hypothetical protein
MKMRHLGNGIAVFENAVEIDEEFIKQYISSLRTIGQRDKYINQQGRLINMGGYEFDAESVNSAPERFIDTLPQHDLIGERERNFIIDCEKALYLAVVEYCRVFPVATESIKWRVRGHIATYRNGQNIGCHSDVSVPGEIGEPPINQKSLHNTLTAAMLWTDDYQGGELEFRTWGISVKPPAGSILLYPSTFIGAHEVLPTTSGERISYLQWFCHGYLSEGMPPVPATDDYLSQYRWLPHLMDDVGKYNLYQRQVN